MSPQLSKKDIQQKAIEVESIFQQFLIRLKELKKQQTETINKFIKELEQRKIEEIRRSFKK